MTNAIDSALAGINANLEGFNKVTRRVAQPGIDESLSRDVAKAMTSQRGLEASSTVLKIADGMIGSLIDVLG